MKEETLIKMMTLIHTASEDELSELIGAINDRRGVLRTQKRREVVRTIHQGDRVRLTGIRPKYLEGTLATVVGKKTASKFIVELDPGCDPRAIRRFGARPICPATILEKVDV